MSFTLKREFNSFFDKARSIDRVISPHPMTRMPAEIVREIFEAAAHADPDVPLLLTRTCMAWKGLVLETSRLWNNIRIVVDHEDTLEALYLSLLLSKNWPLDIAMSGVCASDELLNCLIPHAHRIRVLELFLYRKARAPFRTLGGAPPEGLSSLHRLAIESASYNEVEPVSYDKVGYSPLKNVPHPLERANDNQNAINEKDLFLIKSLPLLSSLTALVLHAPDVACMDQLQLPRVKTLRLVMKGAPTVLENLTCNKLRTLEVVLDDTSREGWWDLLAKSLTYPCLESLELDVTLDRLKNEWSKPWNSQSFKRLPTQSIIEGVVVALSFSDGKYLSAAGHDLNVEYLCSDLLKEFTESLPSLKELRLLHVPYLHAPFIWPSPEVLHNLRRLELQVPAVVSDGYISVTTLPNLRDLRYYGHVSPETTQLPRLRTPSLEYLEIMHHVRAIHPILVQVDRHWPGVFRRPISYGDYSISRKNSSKDFPAKESLPNPRRSDLLLSVIHQSRALRELRLYYGNDWDQQQFKLTYFPELRALHCSPSIFRKINAPKLEGLHFLWISATERGFFGSLPSEERVQKMLHGLTKLDIYSHIDPRFHEVWYGDDMKFDQWALHLHSLQTLILAQEFRHIDHFISLLSSNPRLCPMLTTIDSFSYLFRWSFLRDCIEKRNHFAMQDPSIHPIRTLCFPLALHRNISDRLKESLSGEFASPFVAVPLQPYALEELIQPEEKIETRPEDICFGCLRSGNAFECARPRMDSNELSLKLGCSRHWNRGSDRGAAITAYNLQLSGYLEGA
jgi:hypothetical protein